MIGRLVVLALVGSSLSLLSWGRTQFEVDGAYVYFRTPYSEMSTEEQRYLVYEGIKVTRDFLEKELPESRVTRATIKAAAELDRRLESLLGDLDQYLAKNPSEYRRIRKDGLRPSAFTFYFGGRFTAAINITAGKTISLGLVVLPIRVDRIHKITKVVDTYYEWKTAWIGIPQVSFGRSKGETGEKVGKIPVPEPGIRFGAGVGFIWGTLDEPDHYIGPFFGAEKIFGIGRHGVSLKFGILHRFDLPGALHNPYVAVGYVLSAGSELKVPLTGDVAWIVDTKALMAAMGILGRPDGSGIEPYRQFYPAEEDEEEENDLD